jgi:hypothetical protein
MSVQPTPPAPSSLKRYGAIALMFLPMLGYMVGDWLIAHWAVAKQLDELLKPYAFNAALLIGLALGLAQLGWQFRKTRQLSSYLLQQLALLLAHTLIPLKFGHFVNGLNVLGLVGLGTAAVYLVDALMGAPLFKAFPAHFSPEAAARLNEPRVLRVVLHIEYAMVATYVAHNVFLIWGNMMLPKALYLLVLPFYAKALWGTFVAFAIGYPRWVRKRAEARRAAEAKEAIAAEAA